MASDQAINRGAISSEDGPSIIDAGHMSSPSTNNFTQFGDHSTQYVHNGSAHHVHHHNYNVNTTNAQATAANSNTANAAGQDIGTTSLNEDGIDEDDEGEEDAPPPCFNSSVGRPVLIIPPDLFPKDNGKIDEHARKYFEYFQHMDKTQADKKVAYPKNKQNIATFAVVMKNIMDQVGNVAVNAFEEVACQVLNRAVKPIIGGNCEIRTLKDVGGVFLKIKDACQTNALVALDILYPLHLITWEASAFNRTVLPGEINNWGARHDPPFQIPLTLNHAGRQVNHSLVQLGNKKARNRFKMAVREEMKVLRMSIRVSLRCAAKDEYKIKYKDKTYVTVKKSVFANCNLKSTEPTLDDLNEALSIKPKPCEQTVMQIPVIPVLQIPVKPPTIPKFDSVETVLNDPVKSLQGILQDYSKQMTQANFQKVMDEFMNQARPPPGDATPQSKGCQSLGFTTHSLDDGALPFDDAPQSKDGQSLGLTTHSLANEVNYISGALATDDVSMFDDDASNMLAGISEGQFDTNNESNERSDGSTDVNNESQERSDASADAHDGGALEMLADLCAVQNPQESMDPRDINLRGKGEAYEVEKVHSVKGSGTKRFYYIEWKEYTRGQYGKQRFTWEPSHNLPEEYRNEFYYSYECLEKEVMDKECTCFDT